MSRNRLASVTARFWSASAYGVPPNSFFALFERQTKCLPDSRPADGSGRQLYGLAGGREYGRSGRQAAHGDGSENVAAARRVHDGIRPGRRNHPRLIGRQRQDSFLAHGHKNGPDAQAERIRGPSVN